MQLILNTYGLQIDRKDGCFLVSHEAQERKIAPKRVSSILITKACNISSPAILLAVEFEIPILLLDKVGKVKARLWSPDFKSIANIRRNQLTLSQNEMGITLVYQFFELKLLGQLSNFSYLMNRRKAHKVTLEKVGTEMQELFVNLSIANLKEQNKWKEQILSVEARIAKKYWKALAMVLSKEMPFSKRSRRPAQDPFNAALNYLYGMLYNEVETALISAGLDPEIGIMHVEAYNQPVLAYDVIEAFRPWADRLLLEMALKKILDEKIHFEPKEGGVWLSTAGKSVLIPEWVKYLHQATTFDGRKIKRKDQIHYQAVKLAQSLK